MGLLLIIAAGLLAVIYGVVQTQALLKAPAGNFEKIKEVILAQSSYELPEIIYSKIEGGHQEYLDWMAESVPN